MIRLHTNQEGPDMHHETAKLPSSRSRAKLFTGASVEADMNTWLATEPGNLVSIHTSGNGGDPCVGVICLPGA